MGINEKNLEKNVSVSEKKIGSKTDTEIEPWFRFPIPKPNFGLTLMKISDLEDIGALLI